MPILDRTKKKHHVWFRNIALLVGSFTITLLLFLTLVIPVFNREYQFNKVKQKILKPVSDWDNDTEAYNYWFAPGNSFGTNSMKDINWSFFRQKFNKHTNWKLEYKRYSYSEWTTGNQYLTVNKSWNSSGFWKINLTFFAPVDIYEARFIFNCNLSVLQYVEKDDYEVWVNYSFNATENISLMFNWSDLLQYSDLYFQKGVQNNQFYFLFGKQGIPAGTYVFDPIFGYSGSPSNQFNIDGYIMAVHGEATGGDGAADNITAMLSSGSNIYQNITCNLYTYVSDTDASSVIETTETRTWVNEQLSQTWYVFNFGDPKPSITNNTKYFIGIVTNDTGGSVNLHYQGVGSQKNVYETPHDGVFEDPLTGESSGGAEFLMYCSYTVSAAGETWEGHNIELWNTTLVNGTFNWYEQIELWNTTLVNLTWTWDNNNIETWNITLVNGTFTWDNHNIQSWNVTLTNSSAAEDWENNIEQWNVTLVNGTFDWYDEIESWNATLVNLTWTWDNHNIASWNVTLTNGSWENEIELWNTTLVNSSVDLMSVSNVYPGNNSINIPLQPTMWLTINHSDGETMNISWYYGTQGNENTLLGTDTNIVNSSQSELNWNASERITDYYWRVMVDDGTNYQNFSYTFKTEGYTMGGGGLVSASNYLLPLALASFAFMFGILVFIGYKKKRRNE